MFKLSRSLAFRVTADTIHMKICIVEFHPLCALKFSLKAVFNEVLKVCINWAVQVK